MKKFTLVAILLLCTGILMCSCKGAQSGEPTGDISTTDDGMINVDMKPTDDKTLMSEAAQYKPESGYTYEKVESTVAIEDVEADGYLLNGEDGKTNIASVYYERGEMSYIEIDINLANASDADIKSAITMTRSLILSSFDNFPLDEVDGQLPLSVESIKSMLKTGQDASETVYSQEGTASISYEFAIRSKILMFRLEL